MKQLLTALIVLATICQSQLYAQVMITKDSKLLDTNGDLVSYSEFIESMNSGTFTVEQIVDEHGNAVGYKLVTLLPDNSDQRLNPDQPYFLIDAPITVPIVYDGLFLVRADVNGVEGNAEGWLIVDTGTFIPLILLPESLEKIGMVNGVQIGQLHVDQPSIGTYEYPEVIQAHGKIFTERIPDQLDNLEIIGILGGTAFAGNSYTIDLHNNQLTLYPGTVEQEIDNRSIYAEYRDEANNIWVPISIGQLNGYAHFDTGYHTSWVDSSVNTQNKAIQVGNQELVGKNKIDRITALDQSTNFEGIGFRVIMGIGNDILENYKVTVDTVNRRIIFEHASIE